jgi:trk system potassium uptake protein TrkA
MKAVILGCGRVGAMLAARLAAEKWDVTAVDANPDSFAALGEGFPGKQISGRITDEEVLRAAGLEAADLVVVLTSDDIVNLMAAQMARTRFNKDKVIVRVRDAIKAGAYQELGLQTICPSRMELDAILKDLAIGPRAV